MANLRGRGPQRQGPSPVHSHPGAAERTFSVHLGKNAIPCFHEDCAVQGNVLDFWAAIQRLPLYEAVLHLAETFNLTRSREEEPVARTRSAQELAQKRLDLLSIGMCHGKTLQWAKGIDLCRQGSETSELGCVALTRLQRRHFVHRLSA